MCHSCKSVCPQHCTAASLTQNMCRSGVAFSLVSSWCMQVAMQQADYVAWNIWASINNRPLLSFKYQHLGTMMSFGRSSAAVKLNLPVPSGVPYRCHASVQCDTAGRRTCVLSPVPGSLSWSALESLWSSPVRVRTCIVKCMHPYHQWASFPRVDRSHNQQCASRGSVLTIG